MIKMNDCVAASTNIQLLATVSTARSARSLLLGASGCADGLATVYSHLFQ